MPKNVIEIIQGDTLQKNVLISGVSETQISKVYFSCKKIEIEKELTYDSEIERYVLRIESDETKELEPITTDYDLTIKFTDDDVSTVLYRGILKVLPKVNEVGDLTNGE